jgi:anti-sigma regulatory factor (Ser/Thr protein kinase)
VLFGADPDLARTFTALRVTTTVPVAAHEICARPLLERRPPAVARHLDLERGSSSPRRARRFVESACADWQLDQVRVDAVVVASELVTNAVQHAGTACRLTLRYRAGGLTITVYDQNPDLTLPLRSVSARAGGRGLGGRGLFAVAALSSDWGVSRNGAEKCVWAFLPVSAGATYSHTVRTAARDILRAVLAHGADSPDAASAVRHLVTWLAAQRGRAIVRDVADELASELAEASAVHAAQGTPDRPAVDAP